MRTRYWGLYSLRDKTWRSAGAPYTSPVAFQSRPIKRDRYNSFQAAIEGAESWKTNPMHVVPRAFYVTTKLPPEAQAVIDAVKRYDACGVGWKAVIDALRAYETKC